MKIFFALIVLGQFAIAKGQDAYWDTYLARYDKGVGSVTLNMDLVKVAPVGDLPFLVITGVGFKACTGEGLPEKDEFDKLYKVSNAVNKVIFSSTKSELAGTFTYQCQRLDYLFVKDTVGLREKLVHLYKNSYRSYPYYINIRLDRDWDAYLNFLYPNEETRAFMQNSRVVDQLKEAGDKLDQPRIIEHWLYFESEEGRRTFIGYITGLKFKVQSVKNLNSSKFSYQLQIARPDRADLESISTLTRALREKAKEYGGEYDGWTSPVVNK